MNRGDSMMVRYPNIEAERAKVQLTRTKTAQYLGVTRKTFSEWCKNGRIPATALIKLSVLFGCSIDYLLGLTDNSKVS